MRRVKIAKYTREKKKSAWAKYDAEQAKIKYKTWENMRDILAELWKSQPFTFVLLFMGNVVAYAANSLFGTFTSKYVVELALAGLNGAGKTTLIKLMSGLYDPTEGEIFLNGKPVNSYNRDEYFSLFGAVFQDISVLPVTVAENVAGADIDNIDMDRVYDCLKKAGIYDKVMSLPEKENTRLVKSVYENATEFSGGQTQKLAMARALYKNASVLLLDEPTAALDPIAEQEMYLNYADFSKGKSSVFISHRLASTRFCDRIIMIENGTIAEEGTHAELMEQGGKYAELFELQSSYYRHKEVHTDE